MESSYAQFLASKTPRAQAVGIVPDAARMPAALFDYQRHCVDFALRLGRAGIFLDTGLGKTAIELAFAEQAAAASNGRALILAPLAVGWQIVREAHKFGIEARQIRAMDDASDGINVCNYDRLAHIDADRFGCIVLDEASILKSFTGKMRSALVEAFSAHRFRMTATATPAPNDHMELGNQCEFLGVMRNVEMLSRWFINDSGDTGTWRLKGHAQDQFWDWMASWSRMAENPSDMGFPGDRFVLPRLRVIYHNAEAEEIKSADGLFAAIASATTIHDIKRQTSEARAELVGSLVAQSSEPAVVWCDTDYEADALRKVMPNAIEVRGSMPTEHKESNLEAFASGEARVLITKPSICGFGLNWQHCNRMIFAGRTFSYESWYQAVRRCWRFGQTSEVFAHVIVAQGEDQIASVIARKSDDHIRMKRSMTDAMRRAIGRGDAKLSAYNPQHNGTIPQWLRSAA